ncbi:MAG: aminomethyl-transferring glycine dehydrogenase subunit GcvPB, partial [Proteobacteria bacterium]|nr:aminomethyl-transferring glycine dehydrogenase subunit GcvPB [Pseudomonadota bacterium]
EATALGDGLGVLAGADEIVARALGLGINLRVLANDCVGVSFDETVGLSDVGDVLAAFGLQVSIAELARRADALGGLAAGSIPDGLARASEFMLHENFHCYRSETEMMRYLRHLSNRDIGLDTAMIPLGSCTMKLNASAEMAPISWPGFAQIHPHVPLAQRRGYARLVSELEQQLCELTGFDAVSVQPNAGSQGEFAGILAVKEWHAAHGQSQRNVCLIPRSAHGTNPASASMCGMRVVVVGCDSSGNIDIDDLRVCLDEHGEQLALMMVTYPSTHGVFEERITEVCALVHEHGGQVYMDGANLNAMVGLCYPGRFGFDVAHLNLHKTFCIPHGGGGPGVGPVCVKAHLEPFLPDRRRVVGDGSGSGAVAGAEWGSAGILPISWSYIHLMGRDGLRQASEYAILNANYIARRLSTHYSLLYTNERGRIAHECIIDIRPFKSSAGVEVEDVAKRLVDYGFHPPTMSFPVPGTLMIEPTESESKVEIDRFVEAMVSIRREIADIEDGKADRGSNMLKNAPHCLEDMLAAEWPHPYSRVQAAYPLPALRRRKHWPPVSRIAQVYGDRNLVCSCPPLEQYE